MLLLRMMLGVPGVGVRVIRLRVLGRDCDALWEARFGVVDYRVLILRRQKSACA